MNLRTVQLTVRLVALLLVAVGIAPARAELHVEKQSSDEGELTVFQMTVTPAAEPVPALKHRLVLRELNEKPGNAAPFYYRAIMAMPSYKETRDKLGDQFENYVNFSDVPLEDVGLEKLRSIYPGPHDNLEAAASRPLCDWSWRLGDIRGPQLYGFIIEEAQKTRELSRLLTANARVAIADRNYDEAINILRINAKLGRDVSVEPLLVCGLVGIAIESIGERAMIELIAAPDSPNLYWALAELPSPLIDMREALRSEMGNGSRIFPFMIDAETQEHSADEWARLLAEAIKGIEPLTSGGPIQMNDTLARLAVTGLALGTYGPAKQRLIEGGWERDRVEQMPAGQVIAIDAAHEYRRIADEFEKRWYVSYLDSAKQAARFKDPLGDTKLERGFGGILAAILLPATVSARTAQERLQWQTDALRTVEAIRMHAAETGKLPASLGDIEVVPVPVNPVTGNDYQYRLDGDTGVLELPFSDGFSGVAWRFEIKLAK